MGPSQISEILRPLARLGEILGSLGRRRRDELFSGTTVDRMSPEDLRDAASVAEEVASALREEADRMEARAPDRRFGVGSGRPCATSHRTG